KGKKQLNEIRKHFNDQPFITNWNVDLQDIDKVLRIETPGVPSPVIVKLVTNAGYYCEELY
ncbi:MAG: hypothetical protein ABIR81_05490, partial [Ginsengibacter sp.]